MRCLIRIFCILLMAGGAGLSPNAFAAIFEPNDCLSVFRVVDGDTLIIQHPNGRRASVRLSGIDAPEKSQRYGHESRLHLTQLVLGQCIEVQVIDRDRYGRDIVKVMVWVSDDGFIQAKNLDAGLEQIRAGWAWHYKRYSGTQPAQDRLDYAHTEKDASHNQSGLWVDPHPIAPWTYRQETRPHKNRTCKITSH